MKHLQAGFAKVKITPPMGTPMAGYYFDRISNAVHDDLYAKALVLDDGERRWALVACDLQRPAAVEQLAIVGEQVSVPVFRMEGEKNPVKVARKSLDWAADSERDVNAH